MDNSRVSHFKIHQGVIVPGPVRPSPFVPGRGNILPRFGDALSETSWELWYFDCVSPADHAAMVVGINRGAEGRHRGGFKVQVFAVWPDRSTWHRDLFFPESVVRSLADGSGDTVGIWMDPGQGSSVSFQVSADSLRADVGFDVPGVVEGRMSLVAMPGDTGLDISPELGPAVYCVRSLARASVTANMSFYASPSDPPRSLRLGQATGGLDRTWSQLSWPQFMTECYYLRAQVGPYAMQLLRYLSDPASGSKPYTHASLYRDGKLICAAHHVSDLGVAEAPTDSLQLHKLYDRLGSLEVMGDFRDRNTGYRVEFVQAGVDGHRWRFHARHERTLWNMATSAAGPEGTGNTGFVDLVDGGLVEEQYFGVGTSGQVQLG